MTEFEILHLSNQIFINNAIYTIAVILMTALAFYLIRRANELNSPTYGKAILTFFCTFPLYFGIEVASYFSMNQKNTSFQLSELKEAGVKLSTVAESYITEYWLYRCRWSSFTYTRASLHRNVRNYWNYVSCKPLG